MFTTRYGLIPYKKQVTFSLYKIKLSHFCHVYWQGKIEAFDPEIPIIMLTVFATNPSGIIMRLNPVFLGENLDSVMARCLKGNFEVVQSFSSARTSLPTQYSTVQYSTVQYSTVIHPFEIPRTSSKTARKVNTHKTKINSYYFPHYEL